MRVYLVRFKKTKEIQGVYWLSGRGPWTLCEMIDHEDDPYLCEYTVLKDGGVFWSGEKLAVVPMPSVDGEGDYNEGELFNGAQLHDMSRDDFLANGERKHRWHDVSDLGSYFNPDGKNKQGTLAVAKYLGLKHPDLP